MDIIIFCIPLISFPNTILLNDGGYIYYEEYGVGEPVILLHGHTLDRRMWNEQVNVLKEHYRVITPDFRGYGLSSNPIEDKQFTYADDIIQMLDSLHIEKTHVIGLSMGAYVAGDLLAIYPDRLTSCMMVSGEISNRPGPTSPKTGEEKRKQQLNNQYLLKDGVEAYKMKRINELITRAATHNENMKAALTQMITDWGAWQILHTTVRVYYGNDAFSKLRKTKPKIQTLIIYGAKEQHTTSRLLQYLPNSKQITAPNCGHMVNMEQPSWFNDIVVNWLKECSKK
ncbi:MAG: alpha/beta hydrolase [Bacteroidales bacterium]|nr:alpha/beta hydrolase [Bacteroidales bacterium]